MKSWLKNIFKYWLLRVIYLYDDILILFQGLRPSTYIINLRTINFSYKNLVFDDNTNLCVFIIYELNQIPTKTLDFLKHLKKKNVLLFVVINSKISSNNLEEIQAISDLVLERNNRGKDIGAYKDAYSYIFQLGLNRVARIIFANDSVVYLGETTDQLIDELCNRDADLTGYSHVQEIHYHIQSFLFSCSNSLINHKKFIKFWSKYRPIDRRRYMIHKGEVGITKCAIKASATIKIINSTSDLYKLTDPTLISEIIQSLPTENVIKTKSISKYSDFQETGINKISRRMKDIEIINLDSNDRKLDVYDDIRKEANLEIYYKTRALIEELGSEISYKNNATWGTFIFRLLKRPMVIKRDLCYRGGYRYEHLKFLLEKYFPQEAKEIISMMKPPAKNHHKGIKYLMFENGII
jgi:hypothetical protein